MSDQAALVCFVFLTGAVAGYVLGCWVALRPRRRSRADYAVYRAEGQRNLERLAKHFGVSLDG